METIEPIPVNMSLDAVQAKVRAPSPGAIETLLSEALSLAEAKAAFAVAYIDEKGADEVVIEGRRFRSRVLRKNLETVGRVFPAVVTIGSRLELKADQSGDLLEKYYLDMIGNLILAEARSYVSCQLCRRFAIDTLSWMSPGSLAVPRIHRDADSGQDAGKDRRHDGRAGADGPAGAPRGDRRHLRMACFQRGVLHQRRRDRGVRRRDALVRPAGLSRKGRAG